MSGIIPFMDLMIELLFIFDIQLAKLEFFCRVFEYNLSCVSVADSNKLLPRTKYIANKYHHFQSFVQKKNM